jgi:hypothetical protein
MLVFSMLRTAFDFVLSSKDQILLAVTIADCPAYWT